MITQNTLPTAELLVGGKKHKLYGKKKNKLYLNDGEEFQIKLKNNLQNRVGMMLKINGEYDGDKLLVLEPNQEYTLDRFLNDRKKFLFKTYEITGTASEVKRAVKTNGTVEVVYFNEKPQVHFTPPINYWDGIIYSGIYSGGTGATMPHSKDYWFPSSTGNPPDININTTINITGESRTGGSGVPGPEGKPESSSSKYTRPRILIEEVDHSSFYSAPVSSTPTVDYADYIEQQVLINNSFTDFDIQNMNSRTYDSASFLPHLEQLQEKKVVAETGRIESGTKSDQKFGETEFKVGDELCRVKFKLLPYSVRKPIEVKKKALFQPVNNQVVDNVYYSAKSLNMRIYCTNPLCGYRVRNRLWRICPMCGTKL